MTDPAHRAELVERVVTAHRADDPRGGIIPSPSFYDLDERGRVEAFEQALLQRALESALDPAGLSATAKEVLARINRAR